MGTLMPRRRPFSSTVAGTEKRVSARRSLLRTGSLPRSVYAVCVGWSAAMFRSKGVVGCGHDSDLAAAEAAGGETARDAECLTHHVHRLDQQRVGIGALQGAAAESGERRLLGLGATLLGDVQQLREEIGLGVQRLDARDGHLRFDNETVGAHVAFEERRVSSVA